MVNKQKILIVDDDANIAELISLYLTKECFDTMIVEDGESALRAVDTFAPNLILLDLMLPGIDGYQVCREVRSSSSVPIIMLSAKGEIFDKVLGLELGADDYVVKPFDSKEVVARIKAVLRRCTPAEAQPDGVISYDKLSVDLTRYELKVNGQVVTELGTKIKRNDVVEYDDKVVTPERKCYILLNKPKDCVTTSDDPNGRTTVMDLVKGACNERIYPVGRLDRNTTGVLLLTNDGDLASKLTHPKYVKKKIYHVWTDKDISEDDMQAIADGIELEDGPIHADAISYATENDRNQAGIEIHSGRNRIVRRIFESLGYHVTKLDRVYFAGLTKKNLPRGRWRYLTQEEVNFLKMGSFE